jgi:hypothetical protein
VNVRTKNWFNWWSGYTDYNGKFRCSKEYRGKVSYTLRWQYPHNRYDIRNGKRGQAYFNGPNKKRDLWNLKISSGMSWMYAHIFRAGSFYLGQEPYGLKDRSFDYISIEAYNKKSPQAHISLHEAGTSDIKIYKKSRSGANYNSQDLFFFTSHELGHAHHEEIYDGYKLMGVSKEIKEGWACAIGYYMMSSVYSAPIHNNSYYTNQLWKTGGGANSPLMIDMVDNFNQKSKYSYFLRTIVNFKNIFIVLDIFF